MKRARHIAAALFIALALPCCDGGGEDVCISPVPTPNACPNGQGPAAADMDAAGWSGGEPAQSSDTGGGGGGGFAGRSDAGSLDPNAGAVDGDLDAEKDASAGDAETTCREDADGGCPDTADPDAGEADGQVAGDIGSPDLDLLGEDAP